MLAIRMQRTGRKGHAQFRLIVQEGQLNPSSGRVVASLGNYNPHTKDVSLDKEKAGFYLEHGAQPSPRVVTLLKKEGVKLPAWVKEVEVKKQKAIRNSLKLRRNRPAGVAAPVAEPAEPEESVEPGRVEEPGKAQEAEIAESTETAEAKPVEDEPAEQVVTEEAAEAEDEPKA